MSGTLFVRVVAQDKDRGWMLLAGFDAAVIQRTAATYTTLSAPSRASLQAAIDRMAKQYSADEVRDVTAPGVLKRLAKEFGEVIPATAKTSQAPAGKPTTESNTQYDPSFAPTALAKLGDKEFFEKLKSMA